ncbi:MAG: hypothetical protein ACRDY7_00495 [Acidimicrobiia bacterium]
MAIWRRSIPEPARNPLVPSVALLSTSARRALYAAASGGVLRRGSWDGCALNLAGASVGLPVRSRGEAACAFDTSPEAVRQFIEVWDRLWGSNRYCTELLRDAVEYAGLVGEGDNGGKRLPALV